MTALRFFVKVTLDRPETTRHLVFVYEPRKLPRVLSSEEVLRLLEARTRAQAQGRAQRCLRRGSARHVRLLEARTRPRHKAALSVAYGAGLRAMRWSR